MLHANFLGVWEGEGHFTGTKNPDPLWEVGVFICDVFNMNSLKKYRGKTLFKKPSSMMAKGLVFVGVLLVMSCNTVNPPVPLSGNPKRIVSLSPSITETIFALGAGERLAGVTIFCNYPPQAKSIPKVAEFSRVYFEKILWQMPDLVIANRDSPAETVRDDLREYRIPFITVSAYTIDETLDMILDIGSAIGRQQEAEELTENMRGRISEVERKIRGARPVKTIMVFGHEPLIVAGPNTFADDMIRRAGGINIASNSPLKYPRYSLEQIVLEGPEVIIESGCGVAYGASDIEAIKKFWQQWRDIPAVRNGRIVVLNSDIVTRPGPRIVEGLSK
jgi:iron complex transport system substrate-binding protein